MSDSGEILDIKIADIKATSPHFQHESVALAHALTKLKHGLGAAGAPWGDDEQGEKFHKAYGPHVKQIAKAKGDLSAAPQLAHAPRFVNNPQAVQKVLDIYNGTYSP